MKYDLITHLDVPGHPNETTLRFLPDGEMVALVRREGGNTFGWIGRSKAPYKEWTWKETKHRLGGPNFIRLPDGTLWAAGRSYPGGAKTALARMTADGDYEPVLTFPSGGDTSYAGPGLARRPAVDELLLVARRENVDLPGQDQGAAGSREASARGWSRWSMSI